MSSEIQKRNFPERDFWPARDSPPLGGQLSLTHVPTRQGHVLPSLALAGSSIVKFAWIPAVQTQMARLGFAGGKLTFIAVLEIIGADGFLVPRTRSIGLLWCRRIWTALSVRMSKRGSSIKRFHLRSSYSLHG
jgi:DoxX-like family